MYLFSLRWFCMMSPVGEICFLDLNMACQKDMQMLSIG